MHNPPADHSHSLRITCGKRHYTCGWTEYNPIVYTQDHTHNPRYAHAAKPQPANNPNVTHISHTVFTQPISNMSSVTDCLYTLSTFPTIKTININNL